MPFNNQKNPFEELLEEAMNQFTANQNDNESYELEIEGHGMIFRMDMKDVPAFFEAMKESEGM